MNTPTLFSVNPLTKSQIDGFKEKCGKNATVVTLGDTSPELQSQMSKVETLQETKSLAKSIVAEAVKADATHFYFAGEQPTLAMWANLMAEGYAEEVTYEKYPEYPLGYIGLFSRDWTRSVLYLLAPERENEFVCIQPTKDKWREMF